MRCAESWRRCSGRAPKITTATDGRQLQRMILALVLHEHPREMTILGLAAALLDDSEDAAAGYALFCAVRDLVLADLLYSTGILIAPTRAALHLKWLEAK